MSDSNGGGGELYGGRERAMVQGQMLWFNEVKNVGVIETDDGEQVHVRGSDFSGGAGPEGRCGGLIVSFRIEEAEGRRIATNVAFAEESNPRRARLRHAGRGRSSSS